MRHTIAALLSLALASCAGSGASMSDDVTLTPIGEAVQVTENAESTQECEYITELALPSRSPSDVNAIRTLRNQAGDVGANLVLLVMETRTSVARAEGYLCGD